MENKNCATIIATLSIQHIAMTSSKLCMTKNKAATDNQLVAEMNRVLYKSVAVLCRVLTSAHFPPTIGFVDASQFNLI